MWFWDVLLDYFNKHMNSVVIYSLCESIKNTSNLQCESFLFELLFSVSVKLLQNVFTSSTITRTCTINPKKWKQSPTWSTVTASTISVHHNLTIGSCGELSICFNKCAVSLIAVTMCVTCFGYMHIMHCIIWRIVLNSRVIRKIAATFVTCIIVFGGGLLVVLWGFDEFSSFKDGIDFINRSIKLVKMWKYEIL
jgi:hypothetical protein